MWGVLALAIGWTVFIYWWWAVLQQTTAATLVTLMKSLVVVLLLLLGVTYLWISHNKRLAARGRRGRATRFMVPIVERDLLNRPLDMPAQPILREARILIVTATSLAKVYTPAFRRT